MRKCILKGDNKKAYFHRFIDHSYVVEPSLLVGGHTGGVVSYTRALVELEEDGQVLEVVPEEVIFVEPPKPVINMENPHIPEMFKPEDLKRGKRNSCKLTRGSSQ